MCGIAGVIGVADAAALQPAVDRMARQMAHRGPDGAGSWVAPSAHAMFGHARLAIFDPTAQAMQPMTIEGGRFTIVYNGAIYNFRSLRAELERDGVAFRSNSDTEVILRGYARHGANIVGRLDGMFAFAIWDEQEQQGFLARDSFGIKPLYIAETGGELTFASELRALVASGRVSTELDNTALYRYFRHGSIQEPATLLRDVRMLPAGARATWQRGALSIAAAAAADQVQAPSNSGHVERTRAALAAAVDRHFAGDVPAGVLLSGGADSAAIVALATAAGHRPRTFSLVFPDAADRDGADAARSAARLGVPHEVLRVDAASARHYFTDYLSSIDQPSIDGLNTFVASRFVRDRGMKVVLSGIGADELFGGYASFTRVPMLQRFHQLATLAGPLARWTGALVQRRSPAPRVRRIGDLLEQTPTIANAYETFRAIFTRAESRALVRHVTGGGAIEPHDDAAVPAGLTSAETVGLFEMTRYVRNQLLRDSDVMSMASGVELRTPFLDGELLATLSAVPAAIRLQKGKRLLAAAVPEIPEWAFSTPKRCFQLPFERWFHHDWADLFAAAAGAGYPVRADNWYRSWALMTLEQSMKNLKAIPRA